MVTMTAAKLVRPQMHDKIAGENVGNMGSESCNNSATLCKVALAFVNSCIPERAAVLYKVIQLFIKRFV